MRYNPLTGMMEDTIAFDEIAKRIKAFHAERWAKWFRFLPCHSPEVIAYTDADIAAGKSHLTASYWKELQKIKIYLPENGLPREIVDEYADPAVATAFEKDGAREGLGRYAWSDWQITITEEICHEFQWRVIGDGVDDYGEYLYTGYGALDQVETGHTKGFSTAVGQFAATFDLDVHRLIRTLKTPMRVRSEPPNDPWAGYLAARKIPHSEIAVPAFFRYKRRGSIDGADQEDWYLAEQELKAKRSLRPA